MGTYCYTLRKKQASLWVQSDNGTGVWTRHKANLYSFAYKCSYSILPSSGYARMEARAESNSDRAFEEYTGGYVIDGNPEDGLDDSPVYIKVRKGMYFDSYEFPGELVGFVDVRNGKNHLVPHTKWTECTRIKDGTKFRTRMIVSSNGKPSYEEQEIEPTGTPVHCEV